MNTELLTLEIEGNPDDNIPEGYEIVEERITSSDMEKGITYYTVVLKRESDNKYFKGEYGYSSPANVFTWESSWYEVFPKQITITVYE